MKCAFIDFLKAETVRTRLSFQGSYIVFVVNHSTAVRVYGIPGAMQSSEKLLSLVIGLGT